MSEMNFFESQDRARKNTFQLVFLFTLAVITLIIMTNLLVMWIFGYINSEQIQDGSTLFQQIDWGAFVVISAGVGVVVLVGSLYKIIALSAGGKAVAEALGGKLIPQNTDDLRQRQLLNVVEEMAIASGTPAPPIYVLADEPGINAFAAGFSPRDAVIGVTQGTIDRLNRDQLQGIIAHEFSHILNGDMRLNIRLIGVLNGILIIGIIGYFILRVASSSGRRRRNGKGAAVFLVLAIGLMIIGFAGSFFGGLIKATMSRQREYLADASAVQFTRNPEGIAGALKRIGGLEFGSRVENPGASEVSHAFFARGISGFMQLLFATHPPLTKRILRIDPHWNGEFDAVDKADSLRDGDEADKKESATRKEHAKKVATVVSGTAMSGIAAAIDQIGSPNQEAIDYARSLISELPMVIREAARDPYGARAVIYSMVLDSGQEVRGRQLKHLQEYADSDVFELTHKLMPEMNGLDIVYRLPLVDIIIPTLKQLSIRQYKSFRENLVALIEMDSRVDLLEWSLQKILFSHLDGQFFKLKHTRAHYSHLGELKKEIEFMLSAMAHASHQDQKKIEEAFSAATETLKFSGLKLLAVNEINLSDLDRSLQEISRLKPLAKLQLLKASAASVVHDRKISPVEFELLRAFSGALDCPMPPMVPS